MLFTIFCFTSSAAASDLPHTSLHSDTSKSERRSKCQASFAFAILITVAKLPSLVIVLIYIPIINISPHPFKCVLTIYIENKKVLFWFLIFNFVECSWRSLTRISEDQAGAYHYCWFSDMELGSNYKLCNLIPPVLFHLQSSPNYHEEKYRCEYLHNKLAHIKRLIGEFDQQQAEAWH